ncbi:ABC transporter substrate-binding protein [Haploplasma axanthum]|uniref:Uncharacterized protein n=1 Tax=Haploplasma axanthum TaxID=29552 RepID=A0A449BCW8_HAPAX|nr:hypothetical protein [Haploplasma axanthum]VEU80294.1 Uncharacterised protein [Haploplasma axanthum]
MKKIVSILVIILISVVAVSCRKEEEVKTIVIMHGSVGEVDPFHIDYSTRSDREEKQALQRKVEEEFNIKIEYKPYPSNAGWGPARVNAIIEAYQAKKPLADIYWTTTSWTSRLADSYAISPVDEWMQEYGSNIDQTVYEIGSYNEKLYSFFPEKATGQLGLYFNENLLRDKDIENPVDIFIRGEWTWSKFKEWAEQAQAKMSKEASNEQYVLGGMLPIWTQSLIPLNGGTLINKETKRVAFTQAPALETYAFMQELWNNQLFEPKGEYDTGSAEWNSGRVLMHPGAFWFLNADNRWKGLSFDLGYVPYPVSDSFKSKGGEYITYVSGEAVYNVANSEDKERQKLAFQVWNALQLWKTPEFQEREFSAKLRSNFGGNDKYVNAFLSVYNNVYLELVDDLGISAYGDGGWRSTIGAAIKGTDGKEPRSAVESIAPIYQEALDSFFAKK